MKSKQRKIKVHEYRGIKIRELSPDYFQVDYQRDLHRERSGFKTLAEAQTHCSLLATKLANEGTSVLNLSPVQREDAVQALRDLKGKTTLQAAAQFWMRHNSPEGGVTVADAGQRWLAALKAQKCRDTTLVERGHKVERLAADMGKNPIASVTPQDISAWLASKKLTGATWNGYRRAYHAMFKFAVKNKLVESNPVSAIDPIRLDEQLPKPFMPAEVEKIMATAEKHAPSMVPVLAVQFFGGLRPGEALGLDWSAVDFKQKIVRVLPETSKVRRSRIIEKLNPVLFDWLLPYRKAAGPIGVNTPSQFNYYLFRKPIGEPYQQEGVPIAERQKDKRPKGIAAAAGVKWIPDGPRKTFATMHMATHSNAAATATVLGHTGDATILYKHYRGLATQADARRYWKIRPKQEGKVIQFAAAVG